MEVENSLSDLAPETSVLALSTMSSLFEFISRFCDATSELHHDVHQRMMC